MNLGFVTSFRTDTGSRVWLAAIVVLAVVVRLVATLILSPALSDDALSYFLMARGWVEAGEWRDAFGQQAFFSAGYPMLLVPFFALFGASVASAIAANLMLAVVATLLVHRIALSVGGRQDAALLAALGHALWLPGIWNASGLAKENLSTMLLLALAWAALRIARGIRPIASAAAAGIAWGAGVLTGGSSLLLCAGVGVALLARARPGAAMAGGLVFAAAGLLVLTPWFLATQRMVGRPMLTTNAAFNLYLGHNPAATGRFVSIADTPLGPGWNARRMALGEVELSDLLMLEARSWIAAHPGRTAELAATKLALFWLPNLPDAADFAQSRVVSTIRIAEVAQYLVILMLAGWAFASRTIGRSDKWVLGAMIAGFWLLHAVAYIIVRYRDPVMPLLIAMGAVPLAAWIRARREA